MAQQLGLDDPSIIRLTPHNYYSQQPKPQPVKYRGVEHFSEMLVHYNHVIIDLMHNLVVGTFRVLMMFFRMKLF